MEYNEDIYWNERIKTVGFLHQGGTKFSKEERGYYGKYIFQGASILDYGAGDGKLMPLFQEYSCDVVFYDIVEDFKHLIEARYKELGCSFKYEHYTQTSYTKFDINKRFDIVYCASVLMHVRPEKIVWLLKEMKRLAGDGIVLCIAYQIRQDKAYQPGYYCFNHDYETFFRENCIELKEYIYNNQMAFFKY